ncbi:hypothetical protein EJB05_24512, partial [Eragrostis curvula]
MANDSSPICIPLTLRREEPGSYALQPLKELAPSVLQFCVTGLVHLCRSASLHRRISAGMLEGVRSDQPALCALLPFYICPSFCPSCLSLSSKHLTSLRELIEQYQHNTNNHFEEINHDQQIFLEMTRMKNEVDQLETGLRRFTGDDLSSLTLTDINDLEQQLELSVNKVRSRKHELLTQQLDNLRRKEHILEDQNSILCRMINDNQQDVSRGDVKLGEMTPLAMLPPAAFGHAAAAAYYGGESSSSTATALQLMSAAPQLHLGGGSGGFRLQPTQPNLQDLHHGHGLQLRV